MMTHSVAAIFVDPDNAERAIGALEDHGIPQSRISVATMGKAPSPATPSTPATKDGFLEVQVEDPPAPTDMNAATDARLGGAEREISVVEAEGKHGITTTTAADAKQGAVEGSVVGLSLGLLAGAAALFVPGVGPILAAGPLWAALGGALGATAAGAVAGGVAGYLRDMGVPEAAAAHYAEALRAGSVVVSVQAQGVENAAEIQALLHKYGGANAAAYERSAKAREAAAPIEANNLPV